MHRPRSTDRPARTAALSAILLAAGSGLTAPAAALRSDRDQAVDIVADRSEYDAKSGFTRVEGNVVITQGSLVVKSDEARVFLENSRIQKVEFEGRPATWRQTLDDGGEMNARAKTIDYNVPADLITLIGDALVVHPQGEISGASIEYDLAKEKLRGLSGGDERVRIRIEASAIEDSNLGGERPNEPAETTTESQPPAGEQSKDHDNGNGAAGTPESEPTSDPENDSTAVENGADTRGTEQNGAAENHDGGAR